MLLFIWTKIPLLGLRKRTQGNITITWLFTKNVTPGVHFYLDGSSSGVSAQAEFTANVILLPAPQVSVNPAQVEIDLSWGAVQGNIDYYRIYRSHFEGAPGVNTCLLPIK